MASPRLSVVIPVYNSAPTLPQLMERLASVLERIDPHYEIVFIDDGSADNSWNVLNELRAANPEHIVAIQLMRNYGQHNALMCGFRRARGEWIVTLDDDLQNPPEEIPKLLHALDAGDLDLVYGAYGRKEHRAWRNLGSIVVNVFYRAVFRTRVSVTSFRAIRRPLLESIFPYNLNFTFVDGLLAWNTQRIGEVLVEHRPRAQGRSGYSLGKLIVLGLNLATNFSLLPLQLVSFVGLATALVGLTLAAVYLILYFLARIEVPGYASTIVSILVLGGIQLLSLGIIGEYLGRIHLNINRKPQYVERNVLGPARVSAAPAVAPWALTATEPPSNSLP